MANSTNTGTVEVKTLVVRLGAMDNQETGVITGEHLDAILTKMRNEGWEIKFVTPYALIDAAHVIHYHMERKTSVA